MVLYLNNLFKKGVSFDVYLRLVKVSPFMALKLVKLVKLFDIHPFLIPLSPSPPFLDQKRNVIFLDAPWAGLSIYFLY